MVDNTGSMTVEAIWFNYYEKICFNKEAIKNMQRLRILCIRCIWAIVSKVIHKIFPMTPLSTCRLTCVGLSGMTILGSYCQKILVPKGLFILISSIVRCIIYGMKRRYCFL